METVYRDYQDKVQFFYIYKSLAHPEINNFVSAFNKKERLLHIKRAKEMLHTDVPWICDTMDGAFTKAFGGAPNGEYILDPNGKIVRKRFWSSPATVRSDLESLVGKSQTTTKVADLEKVFEPKPTKIASGVLPPVDLPAGLGAMQIEPMDDDGHPYYAKLRVEGTAGLATGVGELYLAVHLDPLYNVHWNNEAGKVSIELECDGILAVPNSTLTAPDVEVKADVDPRQFLIPAKTLDRGGVFIARVYYTVCDDAETFCHTIKQEYEVAIARDGQEGSRPGVFLFGMFKDVRNLDKNKDGNITADEIPAGEVTKYMGHIDYNGNEIIESVEIDRFMKMFNNGRGILKGNDGR